MKKPGWWVRLRLGSKLTETTRDKKLHLCMSHHAACLLELEKVVLTGHSGYNGARALLNDGKGPTEVLIKREARLKQMLNPGPQPAE